MNQRIHSAADMGGAEDTCASSNQVLVPPEIATIERESLAAAAVLFAVSAVAAVNGLSVRQQVAVWRPFQ